jgi:hypothetical protein
MTQLPANPTVRVADKVQISQLPHRAIPTVHEHSLKCVGAKSYPWLPTM